MTKTKLTNFEWQVLKATTCIPLGETRSYQWVARAVGSPKAVRAVGQALKNNPFPLIIPCHRVIRGDGSLGGYSGGGAKRKESLLLIEKYIAAYLRKHRKYGRIKPKNKT